MLDNHPAGALLGLHALTSLHPGSGTALGVVDLPVQRERHTLWPTIPGSSLKGVLRDACRERLQARNGGGREQANLDVDLVTAFGPPTAEADKHAGALSITDARLLAFPVRSLKGIFAWVSCPAALERLQRDMALAGQPFDLEPVDVSSNAALVTSECPGKVEDRTLILEEFEFNVIEGRQADPVAKSIAARLLPETPEYQATVTRFGRQFVILSDDDFTHFVRHATEISARIGLDYETKTVRDGALFYQEFLPPETLFYAVVLANPSRRQGNGRDASGVLGFLREHLPTILQVGGDETTGKGYCGTRLWSQPQAR